LLGLQGNGGGAQTMRINYEQVAALLQDENFKKVVRRFFARDLQRALHGKTVGVSVAFLCFAICAEPGTNLANMEIQGSGQEFADSSRATASTSREFLKSASTWKDS